MVEIETEYILFLESQCGKNRARASCETRIEATEPTVAQPMPESTSRFLGQRRMVHRDRGVIGHKDATEGAKGVYMVSGMRVGAAWARAQ